MKNHKNARNLETKLHRLGASAVMCGFLLALEPSRAMHWPFLHGWQGGAENARIRSSASSFEVFFCRIECWFCCFRVEVTYCKSKNVKNRQKKSTWSAFSNWPFPWAWLRLEPPKVLAMPSITMAWGQPWLPQHTGLHIVWSYNHTHVFNMHIYVYIIYIVYSYIYIYKGSSMIIYGQCFARDGEFQIDPIWPMKGPLRTPRPCCNCSDLSDLRMKLYKGMSSLEVRLQR